MDKENSTDEITSEMVAAGFSVLDDWSGIVDRANLAREVYIAMVRAKDRRRHAKRARVRPD